LALIACFVVQQLTDRNRSDHASVERRRIEICTTDGKSKTESIDGGQVSTPDRTWVAAEL
jgi:hypothetical protein